MQAEEVHQDESIAASEAAPGRHRWVVLSLLFLLTLIMFVARQSLSVMAPVLRGVFHLSNAAYGQVVSALGLGMMMGEFPVGSLMDRLGGRLGLSVVVTWWSMATGSLVLAGSGVQLGISQLWKGSGECGAFSGGVKVVTRLFEKKDRTLAIGIFDAGSMIGATLAPPVIVFLLQHYGFRTAFLAPSLAGFLWVPLWWFVYRREPKAPVVGGQPRTSLMQMLSQSSSWAVMLCRFFIGPVMQFYWYWIPSYLYADRHLSMVQIGIVGWIPYMVGNMGGILGGWFGGVLLRRGISVRNTRRISMYGTAPLCCLSLAVSFVDSLGWALALVCIAIAADKFLSAHMFAAVTDLFPDAQVGRATGLTGIAGGLSGMLFPLLTGVLVDRFSYTPAFVLVGIMPLIGTLALFTVGRKYRFLDQRPDTGLLAGAA